MLNEFLHFLLHWVVSSAEVMRCPAAVIFTGLFLSRIERESALRLHPAIKFHPANRDECERFQMLTFDICCSTCMLTDTECPFGRRDPDPICPKCSYPYGSIGHDAMCTKGEGRTPMN